MRLLISLALVIVISSCTKKREESFVQGHGRDLLAIENFEGKEFEVETLDLIGDQAELPKVSKATQVLKAKEKTDGVFGLVQIKTAAELTKDVPFVALPNKQKAYAVRYVLDANNLIVFKVASKDHLHESELAGAMQEKDGRYSVPLVGYPIKGYFNLENVIQNREKSSSIMESPAKDKSGAKYFKIDLNARTVYKLQDKQDVIPKNYFGLNDESEWYIAMTVTGVGIDAPVSPGWILGQEDESGNTTTKIKFVQTDSALQAISVNRDKRLDLKEALNHVVILSIPAQWKDYQPKKIGTSSTALEEEENSKLDWKDRRYAKLDFGSSFSKGDLADLEIEPNYFSYSLTLPQYSVRLKIAFLRAEKSNYVAKQMFESDFEKFGFFTTKKEEFNMGEKDRREDFGKNVFLNRYNPKKGEIKFHVTQGTDMQFLPMIREAAARWSEAFKDAGTSIQIKIDETPVRLGDLRYNQINLINPGIATGLFGLGPSVTDPLTGEIVMATSNIDARSYSSYIASIIRDYLLYKAELLKDINVLAGMPKIESDIQVQGEKAIIKFQPGERALFKTFPSFQNGKLAKLNIESKVTELNEKTKKQIKFGDKCDYGVTTKNLILDIDQECPELAAVYTALKDGRQHDQEGKLVVACAEKIVPKKMMGTLLHEMGHNFGLRHNFAASSDPFNFWKAEKTGGKDQIESSSVMDYPAFSEDRMTILGRYDIAAIRFGYADSVETAAGGIKALNPLKSIEDQFPKVSDEKTNISENMVRRYRFCTDEDTFMGGDPMCARWDHGRNAFEKVKHLINDYNASIALRNYRRFKSEGAYTDALTQSRLRRTWIPLKQIYDDWRYKLSDQLGVGYEYLENIDAKRIDDLVKTMNAKCDRIEDEGSEPCQFVDLKRAADQIFEFALRIATLPPRLCIGERANGQIAMTEFADVRKVIMAQEKKVPQGCLDGEVSSYIEKTFGFKPTDESGYELEDVRFSNKVKMSKTRTDWWGNPLPEGPDVNGLLPEKAIAMQVLAARASLSYSSDSKSFLPNFLDEPQYRDRVLAYIADRITKGIPAKDVLKGDLLKKFGTLHLERFRAEKDYIQSMVRDVFWGLEVPGKPQASRSRKRKFLVRYESRPDILARAKYVVPALDGTSSYAIMSSDATEAKKLLQMLETLPKRLSAASPLNEDTFIKLFELADLYLSADDSKVSAEKMIEFAYNIVEDEFPDGKGPRTQDQRNIDKFRAHWKNVFAKEIAIIRRLNGTIFVDGIMESPNFIIPLMQYARDYESYVQNPQMKDYQSWPEYIIPIGKLLLSENYTLNKKTVVDRVNAYRPLAEAEMKKSDNADVFNYDELSTQMDLIMDVLRSMTEY